MQVTFAAVNEAIKHAGGKERLVQVGALFAFTDGNTSQWLYRMVRANDLQEFTVDEWLAHWVRLGSAVKAA